MKLITLCTMLLVLSTISASQQTNPNQTFTKQDYLQKSKNQKVTAWILAGGGVVLEIAGAIAYQKGNAGLFLFGAGLLSQAASIPFFIASGINKRKAKQASVFFKFENTPTIHHAVSFRFNPSISVRLKL